MLATRIIPGKQFIEYVTFRVPSSVNAQKRLQPVFLFLTGFSLSFISLILTYIYRRLTSVGMMKAVH